MTDTPKRMEIQEFSAEGYMAEVNRRVLHPLGLALERSSGWSDDDILQIVTEIDMAKIVAGIGPSDPNALAAAIVSRFVRHVGLDRPQLTGVWDVRDDPEGVNYGDDLLPKVSTMAANVERLWREREPARVEGLGYMVQPVGDEVPLVDRLPRVYHDGRILGICSQCGGSLVDERVDGVTVWGCPRHGAVFVQLPVDP